MSFKTCSVTSLWMWTDWIQNKLSDDVIPERRWNPTWDHSCVCFARWGRCVSLLKPVTFACRYWNQCISEGCIVCYCPALVCLPLTFRFKAECLSMLSIHTCTHKHTPSSFKQSSSAFSQWCRIKLSAPPTARGTASHSLHFWGPSERPRG